MGDVPTPFFHFQGIDMGRLSVTRREGEQILLWDGVVITVKDLSRGRVKLTIEAPEHVPIRILPRSSPRGKPMIDVFGEGEP